MGEAGAVIAVILAVAAKPAVIYVSPAGNDAWSGKLAAPNRARTDGPFATLQRACREVAKLRAAGVREITVFLRGGDYCLSQTVQLGPEHSAPDGGRVVFAAYRGERVRIIGGRRITGWRRTNRWPGDSSARPSRPSGRLYVADLPDVRAGKWTFRSLIVDGRRAIRARHPNFDPADPYRSGFLYVASIPSDFGRAVGNIHNRGDWIEWSFTAPAKGRYFLWLRYAAANKQWGVQRLDGRMAVSVDGGKPIRLQNLPDTGGWRRFEWARCAELELSQGEHTLRWQNLVGGGINLDALALTDDPNWKPRGIDLPEPAAGRHVVLIQAEDFIRHGAKRLSVAGGSRAARRAFKCRPGDIKPQWVQPGAEVHIYQSGSCRAFLEILHLEEVDPHTWLVRVGGPECVASLGEGDRYWVENVPELLDAPGEWYLDREAGRLYYVAGPGFSPRRSEVIAPTVGRIIQVVGTEDRPVRGIRFEGLEFVGGDWSHDDGCIGYGMGKEGVLYFEHAQACAVQRCRFVNIGKYAVCAVDSRAIEVARNEIAHSAEGGVLLINAEACRVVENHIHHCGEVYKHVGGVVMEGGRCSRNLVARNAIHDMSRYGVTFKNAGVENVVEYNFIQNTNLETYDTGGIEVTQHDRVKQSRSKIRYNIVADTIGYSSAGGRPVYLSWGIYLDSYAGGYEVVGNIVFRNFSGGIMLQGGRGNVVVNNIFVDGQAFQGYITNFQDNARNLVLERNIFAWANPQARVLAVGRLGPHVIRARRNLYWCPALKGKGLEALRFGYGGGMVWRQWREIGMGDESIFADPRFVAPERDDYRLRPDSPARKLGFKAIDMRRILRTRSLCGCRCKIVPAGPLFWGGGGEKRAER